MKKIPYFPVSIVDGKVFRREKFYMRPHARGQEKKPTDETREKRIGEICPV
jgi:hypothetical protein